MTAKSVWDICHLDNETQAIVDSIEVWVSRQSSDTSAESADKEASNANDEKRQGAHFESGIFVLQSTLSETERCCRESLETVDSILNDLGKVNKDYR